MEKLQYAVYVFILFTLTSQFIVGYTKDCDCAETKNMVKRVRSLLLDDMFEMKLKNDMLSSKIDRLEQMFQEKLSVSVTSTTPDTSQIDGDKSKSLEVDIEEIQENPEWELKLESLVQAFHSEKEQRLHMESVVRLELKTLNDSFKNFTTHMNAAFTERINTITEDFENFKHNVTDMLFDVENEYKSSIDDVEKSISVVIEKNLTGQQNSLNAFKTHMDAAFTKNVNSVTEKIKHFEKNVTDSLSDFRNEYKSSIDDVEKLLSGVIEKNLTDLQANFNAFTTNMDTAFTKSVNSVTEKINNFEKNLTNSLSDVKNEFRSSIDDVKKSLSDEIETNVVGLQYKADSINRDVSRLHMEVSSVIDIALLNETGSCEPTCSNGGVCFKDNTCRCKRFTEGTQCEKFFCDDSCSENGGECTGPGSCKCPSDKGGVNCEFKLRCETITPSPGVNVSYSGNRKQGTLAFFTCYDDEYILHPNDLRSSQCTTELKWNQEPPKCLREADVTGIYFEGSTSSRLEYYYLQSPRLSFLLSLDLKTTDQDGVIFYNAAKKHFEHISIVMERGRIVCSFNSGTGTGKMTSPQKINDGKWHKLEFGRIMRDGFLQVDQDQQLTWSSPGFSKSLQTTSLFYFGGVNQSQLSDQALINLSGVANSFKGCLANIKVNGEDTGTPYKMLGTKRCLDMEQQ